MASEGHAIACHIPLEVLRSIEPVIKVPAATERLRAAG
jgi:hypothetical protein